MTNTYRKPAEVYLEDGMTTAEHVEAHTGYLWYREHQDDCGQYVPWHRVKRVQRLPVSNNPHTTDRQAETDQSDAQDREKADTELVYEWLRDSVGVPDGEYEVVTNEQYGSINVKPNGQVDWWGDLTGELRNVDSAWWNGDERVWIIQDVDDLP